MCIQEIAVLLGPDGRTIPISEPGTVIVYRRVRGVWVRDREIAFSLDGTGGLRELRDKVGELKTLLKECRVVVAQSASGALFFELEKARCSIWEIGGTPDEFLDRVWRDERSTGTAECQLPGAGIPAPAEISPGCYANSIREIQGKRPEVSSKQILQEFVRKGLFDRLEILCDHLPPWIEIEARARNLMVTTEPAGKNTVKVVLEKDAAGGGC